MTEDFGSEQSVKTLVIESALFKARSWRAGKTKIKPSKRSGKIMEKGNNNHLTVAEKIPTVINRERQIQDAENEG